MAIVGWFRPPREKSAPGPDVVRDHDGDTVDIRAVYRTCRLKVRLSH